MHPDATRSIHGREHRSHSSHRCRLILAGCISFTAGCEEEFRHEAGKPAVSSKPKDSGPIIGRRTQEIVGAAPLLKNGDAKVASAKIVAKDPITLHGNAYFSIHRTSLAIEDRARDEHLPRCQRPVSQRL